MAALPALVAVLVRTEARLTLGPESELSKRFHKAEDWILKSL
jgi:hypothetical protein